MKIIKLKKLLNLKLDNRLNRTLLINYKHQNKYKYFNNLCSKMKTQKINKFSKKYN